MVVAGNILKDSLSPCPVVCVVLDNTVVDACKQMVWKLQDHCCYSGKCITDHIPDQARAWARFKAFAGIVFYDLYSLLFRLHVFTHEQYHSHGIHISYGQAPRKNSLLSETGLRVVCGVLLLC